MITLVKKLNIHSLASTYVSVFPSNPLVRTIQAPCSQMTCIVLTLDFGLEIILVCQGCCYRMSQTWWFKQQQFIFSQFQRMKVQERVQVWSSSFKGSLPGLQTTAFLLCLHMVYREKVPLLIRTLFLLEQGPTRMTSFNLNYFHEGPVSKYSGIWCKGFNQRIQGEHKH